MKTYCISLRDRPDRRELARREFERLGIDPIWFDAIRKPRGHDGCAASHLKLFSEVDEFPVMITEDDVEFINYEMLPTCMEQLPAGWDMLYLGATLNEPLEQYSDNLFRLRRGWTSHAIIYSNPAPMRYIAERYGDGRNIDVIMADEVQSRFMCFITYPLLATQRPGVSDIICKFTDYSAIKTRYDKYTK